MNQMFFQRDNSKIIKSLLLAVVLCCSLLLTACSNGINASLLPAFGAGREGPSNAPAETEPPREQKPPKGITICVDPGHGFDDGGTSSDLLGNVFEKDITLAVSLKLRDFLKERGFDVVMTHDGTNVPKTSVDDGNNKFKPQERTAYANALGSSIDYYISIHCNSFDSPDVCGSIVFYVEDSKKGTNGDKEIASCINDQLLLDFPESKSHADVGIYHVIRYTKVPASLIEIGYVTNENDASNMLDSTWQEKYAMSLADALDKYYSGEYVPVESDADDTAA